MISIRYVLRVVRNDQLQEASLVMEDDAVPVKDFASRLDMVTRGLPEDWDVVQLRSCYPQPLPDWGLIQEGLRIHRKGVYSTLLVSLSFIFHRVCLKSVCLKAYAIV